MENDTHFCNVCGWASEGRACEVCGSLPDEVPETHDHENLSLLAGPQPESYPHLRTAFVAWRQKDWSRRGYRSCARCSSSTPTPWAARVFVFAAIASC